MGVTCVGLSVTRWRPNSCTFMTQSADICATDPDKRVGLAPHICAAEILTFEDPDPELAKGAVSDGTGAQRQDCVRGRGAVGVCAMEAARRLL